MSKFNFIMLFFLGCSVISGCGLLPKQCPENEFIGNENLETHSLEFYPENLPNTLIFSDGYENKKIIEVLESVGEQQIIYEQLCSEETDIQNSYHICEYRKLQYTFDRERFYVELAVWKDYYGDYGYSNYYDDLNDVLKLYREEDRYEPYRLKIVTSSRGNTKQEESEYEFHENIVLNSTMFSNVYKTLSDHRYIYYYSGELGVVAFEERGHLWVMNE